MSTSITEGQPGGALPELTLPRPRLTVVPRPAATTARGPFVVLVITLLAAGLVGLLLLNTGMERGAYQVTALRAQTAALSARQQTLQLQVAALQDPQKVAEKALLLGMVENPSPAFISLSTGKIIGTSVAGLAGDRFDIGTKIGPSVDRLGKVAPIVGGEANSGGSAIVEHQPPKTKTTTKGGDTTAGSQGSRQ